MTQTNQRRPIEVAISNLNLDPLNAFTLAADGIGKFAAGANCSIEYCPTFDLIPLYFSAASVAGAVKRGHLNISSYHSTFRTTRAFRARNPAEHQKQLSTTEKILNLPLVGRVFMPDIFKGATIIGKLQDRIVPDERADCVLYPHFNPADDRRQIEAVRAKRVLVQPSDREARKVGATSFADFDRQIRKVRGYDGYVADTGWMRARFGAQKPGLISSNLELSLPYFAPYTNEIHLSFRNETQVPGTAQECRQAMNGIYDGQLRYMLDVLKEQGNVDRVVIEAPLSFIKSVRGTENIGGGFNKVYQSAYADIAAGIREYWETSN